MWDDIFSRESFRDDLTVLLDALKEKRSFTFSKYADGEYKILRNEPITNCDGWTFDPDKHQTEQALLLESFQYDHPNYLVGISCPCCQPQEHVDWMRDNVGTNRVTWANLFVNNNYEYFKQEFFPIFNSWPNDVTIVANSNGYGKELPFKTDFYLPIGIGDWKNPHLDHIIELMKEKAAQSSGQLFLFSAGPLGNILAHQLTVANPGNTYIDIGSTVNPWIVGRNRGYLSNNNRKICIW